MNDLYLIAVNLTRRCNLACDHCYMDAEARLTGGSDELSSSEVEQLLAQIAARSNETMVVLTGGEPLLRHDLERLVAYGSGLGLAMVIGSNGVLLGAQRVASLKAAGTMGIGISIDSLDPQRHDAFRGCPGSWQKTLAGIEQCRQQGVPFQIHFSITNDNADELPAMIEFARAAGAHVLNIFFLICTGRGESMADITPARYEQVLAQLVEAQAASSDMVIRARCAPHFKRIAHQLDPASPLTRAEGYEGGGCLAAHHYCRITPEGGVTACPYIPDQAGSIRDNDFWDIWDNDPGFQQLRRPTLQGSCGRCEYQQLCGGCRARPLALGGTLMDSDPWCTYEPGDGAVIQPLQPSAEQPVEWSAEAEQRLARVPGFLRKMVRKRAEAHLRELGEARVTVAHMQQLAAQRFGDRLAAMRPGTAAAPSAPQPLAWTRAARSWLDELPPFLADGVRQVAEQVARDEGRLEVNIKLIERLEGDAADEQRLPWEPQAEALLDRLLADRPPPVALFVRPTMASAAEREARRRSAIVVSEADVQQVVATATAGVEWDAEALARVESAPAFIRAGIKKAAEFAARRSGLTRIDSEHLTGFRNRAMLRAVKRMKGFGMKSLNFDAFDIAQQRVPRLRENDQAERRFGEIRDYVESQQAPDGSGLGLLGADLLAKMKAELKGE